MKLTGIYCIRNRVNGKCYVGQSVDIHRRIQEHLRAKTKCMYITRAISKHDTETFIWEVLELCSEELLDDRECHWIAALDCVKPNGYNLETGGTTRSPSEETKKKISQKLKGNKIPPEVRSKISASHTGKPKSAKHRQNIGEANRGRHVSKETREKMSKALTGKKRPPFSDETKRKMSEAARGKKKPWLAELNRKRRKNG